jgi:histidinol-phosphate aminotransferase
VRSVCIPGRTAIMTTPSYGMIRRYIRIAGASLVEVPWWRGDYPVEAVLDRADDTTSLVCVVSPNNPTGSAASRDAFCRLLDSLPRALILLDQAYVDFCDPEYDLSPVALEYRTPSSSAPSRRRGQCLPTRTLPERHGSRRSGGSGTS